MQLGLTTLFQFLDAQAVENLVLATVVETEGPTYRKFGAMILLDKNGRHSGLLSGGCLEADLGEHALGTLLSGQPALVHYDLGLDESATPWGLGLGCGGSMSILLEPVDTANILIALLQLRTHWQSGQYSELHKTLIKRETALECTNSVTQVSEHSSPDRDTSRNNLNDIVSSLGDRDSVKFRIPVSPQRRLYIAGAGPDAEPLASMGAALGWHVTLFDPRKEYLSRENFPTAAQLILKQPHELEPQDMQDPQAIVIMTHNLERDRSFLELSLSLPFHYIGLLGPVARRDLLLGELNVKNDPRLFGPAGLDLDCVLPEDIALSVLAEIAAVLNKASARSLSLLDNDDDD